MNWEMGKQRFKEYKKRKRQRPPPPPPPSSKTKPKAKAKSKKKVVVVDDSGQVINGHLAERLGKPRAPPRADRCRAGALAARLERAWKSASPLLRFLTRALEFPF